MVKPDSEIIINSEVTQKLSISFQIKPNITDENKKLLYKQEVEYMDRWIGKIIEYLKQIKVYKKTIIVFVGDHGEGLGEYRHHFGHIHFLRPQYIRVPLLFKFPDDKKKIIRKNISTIDIVPTLLAFLKMKSKLSYFSGKNILKKSEKRDLFAYTYRPESYLNGITIINGNFQFIYYTGVKHYREFLDLKISNGYNDSDNMIHLPKYINIIKKMRGKAIVEFKKSSRKNLKKGILTEKTKKILKSLGYL